MSEFDQYRDAYSDDINDAIGFSGQSHDFFTKVKADCLRDLLQRNGLLKSRSKVLDVGCGHGHIHDYLDTLPVEITGVDVAARVLETARQKRPGINYLDYDGSRLPFDDDSFDLAYTICVMHHVAPGDWRDFLKEMRRVVKPGGIVAVFEHNPLNPLTLRVVNSCPMDDNAVLLRSGQLVDLLTQTGLDGVRKRFILFTPFAGRLFEWFDRALGWLPLGAQYFATGRVPAP